MAKLIELVARGTLTIACLLAVGWGAVLCNEGNGWGSGLVIPGSVILAVGMTEVALTRDRS